MQPKPKRFVRFGNGLSIAWENPEEAAEWLNEQTDDILEAWIGQMESSARGVYSWGDLYHMRETYNHMVDVLTLIKKMRGEDFLE